MGRRTAAFSLIELIVVLLIMGSVGAVLVACFTGGLRAYARAREFGQGETEAYLTFESMERDLRNAVAVPGVAFKGDPDLMQFSAMDALPGIQGKGEAGMTIILARYWMTPQDGVVRQAQPLGDAAATETHAETLLSGGMVMELAYRDCNGDAAAGPWLDTWQNATNLPRQVRIRFAGEALDEGVLERTVTLPAGGGRE